MMDSFRAYAAVMKGLRLWRGARLRAWCRLWGAKVGSRLEVEKGVLIRWAPHPGLRIGAGVYLGKDVVIDVPNGALLAIGRGSRSCMVRYWLRRAQLCWGSRV